MFRIDAICDRINFKLVEDEENLKNCEETSEKFQEDLLTEILKHDETQQTRKRIYQTLNRPGAIEELATVMRIINKNYEQEIINKETKIATHLMAIFLHSLESPVIWFNFCEIISSNRFENVRKSFNELLSRHQIVLVKILEIIRNYFDSLCEFNEEFFIDTTSELLNKKLQSLQLHEVILVIHQILSIHDIAGYVSQKIFLDFDFNPSFVNYLKLSLNNLTL